MVNKHGENVQAHHPGEENKCKYNYTEIASQMQSGGHQENKL